MTTKVETVAERIARLLKEKTAPVQEVTVSPTEMLDTKPPVETKTTPETPTKELTNRERILARLAGAKTSTTTVVSPTQAAENVKAKLMSTATAKNIPQEKLDKILTISDEMRAL
jgi:hypothetical protein